MRLDGKVEIIKAIPEGQAAVADPLPTSIVFVYIINFHKIVHICDHT